MTQRYGSRFSVLPQIGDNTVSDEVGNSRQPDDRGGEFTGESEATSSAAEVRLRSPGLVQPEGECPHLRNTGVRGEDTNRLVIDLAADMGVNA